MIATLFATVSGSAFDVGTADLIIQANFGLFLVISLGLLLAPFLKLQRYQVRVRRGGTRLFHYQEAMVIVAGILFFNIPLMFLAHALSMYESMAYMATLGDEARRYLESAAPFLRLHTPADVATCAVFGAVLRVIKAWGFKRVAKRFVQSKRFRAARAA